MEYKLLNGNSGIITTRQPEVVSDTLKISFIGVPEKATVIFEREDGVCAYRLLSDEKCEVKSDWLKGSVKVIVAILNGSMCSQRWFCESFRVKRLEHGLVIISPEDEDMQKKIVKLQEAVDDLETSKKELFEKQKKLEIKIDKIYEGYDIV